MHVQNISLRNLAANILQNTPFCTQLLYYKYNKKLSRCWDSVTWMAPKCKTPHFQNIIHCEPYPGLQDTTIHISFCMRVAKTLTYPCCLVPNSSFVARCYHNPPTLQRDKQMSWPYHMCDMINARCAKTEMLCYCRRTARHACQ